MSSPQSSAHTTPTMTPRFLPSQLSLPSPPNTQPTSSLTSSPKLSDLPGIEDDVPHSFTFRARSRSPGDILGIRFGRSPSKERHTDLRTPPNSPPSTWWGGRGKSPSVVSPRPWRDPPKRRKTVPAEQTEGWEHTRRQVAQAVASVLGTTGDILKETLVSGVSLLEFAPVPGLRLAAEALLQIWNALQLVDMNRLACLRLTERCADILLSVRQEIKDAGDTVGDELASPIEKLVESFNLVFTFLHKQTQRPFLKRYLRRTEILNQINECNASLNDALGTFGLSISIRILRQVQESDRERAKDSKILIDLMRGHGGPVPPSTTDGASGTPTIPPSQLPGTDVTVPHDDVISAIRTLHETQNSHDTAEDLEDLRGLMRTALATSSDVEMLSVLQIERKEMLDAIKTLQRALEKIVEKQGITEDEEKVNKVGKRSKKKSLKRKTAEGDGEGGEDVSWEKDVLHREFIESGIDALRRLSKGVDTTLPSWTITRYEVDREQKIGIGFFSDVYRGTWRGRTVAIKVLAESTPRELFRREADIWQKLKHENVLELLGASSTYGDSPWFFVSPYKKNGSLVEFLKRGGRVSEQGGGDRVETRGRPLTFPVWKGSKLSPGGQGKEDILVSVPKVVPREGDLFRFMLEIAKGMEYLHANGVLHGDLKASNVLVDDKLRCVISDFGQSEMKSEVYRISRTAPLHGTLRWQCPELMSGISQLSLTPQMDVYAYAISSIEILSLGKMPWPLMDDDAVRHAVLVEGARPSIPATKFDTPLLRDLLRMCWHRDPASRPTFMRIVNDVKAIRKDFSVRVQGQDTVDNGREESSRSPIPTARMTDMEGHPISRLSPDMRPQQLPNVGEALRDSLEGSVIDTSSDSHPDGPALHVRDGGASQPAQHPSRPFDGSTSPRQPPPEDKLSQVSLQEVTVPGMLLNDARLPGTVLYTPSLSSSSSSMSSSDSQSPNEQLDDLGLDIKGIEDSGNMTPLPVDEKLTMVRDERRYRLWLNHTFHPSLTLPLWDPSHVELGAVGYLSKPLGSFVTLFNSFSPETAEVEETTGLPSLYGYGHLMTGSQRQDKRNVALRGLDAFVGLLTFRGKGSGNVLQSVNRRYSFPLRAGHKTAYIYTEATVYRYVERLDVPKKWFKANVDAIMKIYGPTHHIQKEDLFLVIGKLDAADYGLFVSHHHPDGQAHFNVFTTPKAGQPWGTFTTDTGGPPGPSYNEPALPRNLSASKVSTIGGPWNTVLVAKLRFKPDVLEPTSL